MEMEMLADSHLEFKCTGIDLSPFHAAVIPANVPVCLHGPVFIYRFRDCTADRLGE
jgi:hypothetical protein